MNGYRVYDDDNFVAQTSALAITFIGLENGQSHDYAVSGLFVPRARAIPFDAVPRAPGPLVYVA